MQMEKRKKSTQENTSENLVIVRAFGDKPLIRAVIGTLPGGLLVCMPDHAEAIRSGQLPAPMVGFSKRDVFAYDEAMGERVVAKEPVDWSILRPIYEAAN
jgi:hypothetical protein